MNYKPSVGALGYHHVSCARVCVSVCEPLPRVFVQMYSTVWVSAADAIISPQPRFKIRL